MRGSPGLVIRHKDPEWAKAEIETARASRNAAVDKAERWARRQARGAQPGCFVRWDDSFAVTGLIAKDGFSKNLKITVPEGWRWDTKSKSWQPALKTDRGKDLARSMRKLDWAQPLIDGIGGIVHTSDHPPETPSHERRSYFTGWAFHVFETDQGVAVFACIGQEYLDDKGQQRIIDLGERWEPARLSEYHMAREAAEDFKKTMEAWV